MNLRRLAKGQDCTVRIVGVCNGDPSTVVLAHYRLPGLSGLGIKPPDVVGAYACSSCHAYVDTHHDDATQLAFAQGCFRTQAKLIRDGVLTW